MIPYTDGEVIGMFIGFFILMISAVGLAHIAFNPGRRKK